MSENYFQQTGGAELAKTLGLSDGEDDSQTLDETQEIEEEESQDEETPEESEADADPKLQIPKKFLGKDGKPNVDALAKSYAALEKEYDRAINGSKEKDKALADLQSWANNTYAYIQKNMSPAQKVDAAKEVIDQAHLTPFEKGKLMEELERDPEPTMNKLVAFHAKNYVQEMLMPVLQPLQERNAENVMHDALEEMQDDPEQFPYLEAVADTMADIYEDLIQKEPNVRHNPNLLPYLYDMALGKTTANREREAEERGRQSAFQKTQQKRKTFAEGGNSGKRGNGKSSEGDFVDSMISAGASQALSGFFS